MWRKVKIGDFLKERKGKFKPNDKSIQGLKRIEKINFSGEIFLSMKSSRTNMILIKKGDLVISGINIYKGALAVYEGQQDIKATIHYSSYIFDSKNIDIDYLKWFLSSKAFLNLVKEQVKGGIKTEIKAKHLLPIEISLPDLSEQKKILKKIQQYSNQYFEIEKELNFQKAHISKLKQSILQEAIEGKLTEDWRAKQQDVEPASLLLERIKAEKARLLKEKKIKKQKALPAIEEEEKPFELPEGWLWCRLGDVINLKSGQDLKPYEYSNTEKIGIPYITGASNLHNEKVIVNRWTKAPRSIAKKGDLLLTCKGSGVGKMGWLHVEEAHIARQIMAINTICSSLPYIKIIMNIKATIYRENATGLIPGIDRLTVLKTLIPLPPLDEQVEIVKKTQQILNNLSELEAQVQQSLDDADLLMQVVLQEAFEQKESS